MSLDNIIKAKIPAFPKEIDDKNIAGEFKKWEKAYADIQAAAKDFASQLGKSVNGNFGIVTYSCLKKMGDKNIDPKQKKALETLHKAVSELEGYVGKL